jgi:hypothetical protein
LCDTNNFFHCAASSKNLIVDAGGLLNGKGLILYNELEAELQQAFNASPYLLNKLLPKLNSTVFMPRLKRSPPASTILLSISDAMGCV